MSDNEDEVRRLAYEIAQDRLRARPGPLGGTHAPLPHRFDVDLAMDEARKRITSQLKDKKDE
jgi:hypothetical protein